MAKYISFGFMCKDTVCTRVDIENGIVKIKNSRELLF